MGHFLPLHPLTAQKLKTKNKFKKGLEISSFYIRVRKIMIRWCTVPVETVYDRCNCYFSFWAIFCLFTPLTAQKIKIFKKMKKTPGDITILHICTKNYNQMMYSSWDMVRDRRMDGWKKSHIEVGAPPKNLTRQIQKNLKNIICYSC